MCIQLFVWSAWFDASDAVTAERQVDFPTAAEHSLVVEHVVSLQSHLWQLNYLCYVKMRLYADKSQHAKNKRCAFDIAYKN